MKSLYIILLLFLQQTSIIYASKEHKTLSKKEIVNKIQDIYNHVSSIEVLENAYKEDANGHNFQHIEKRLEKANELIQYHKKKLTNDYEKEIYRNTKLLKILNDMNDIKKTKS